MATSIDIGKPVSVQIFFIIIIIKKDWQCKAGRGRLTPYQSEDPSPTLPTYRGKEEKWKIVEAKKGESRRIMICNDYLHTILDTNAYISYIMYQILHPK